MTGTRIVTTAHLDNLETAAIAARLEAAAWREIAIQLQMRCDTYRDAEWARERAQLGPERGWIVGSYNLHTTRRAQ